jgi:hypothetical protein
MFSLGFLGPRFRLFLCSGAVATSAMLSFSFPSINVGNFLAIPMVILGMTQLGVANMMFGHTFEERFPKESIPGIRKEWSRLHDLCRSFLLQDVTNSEVYDIHQSMQKQIKTCKGFLTSGANLSMADIEQCHRGIESAFTQCREAANIGSLPNELPSETLLPSSSSCFVPTQNFRLKTNNLVYALTHGWKGSSTTSTHFSLRPFSAHISR